MIRAQASPPAGAPEQFLPAVVLTNVEHSMTIMREETFGPVLCVMPVASMDDAVRLANDCELALTASVWSKNRRTADELPRCVQAGVVMINDHLMSHGLPEVPWGGCKHSGIGRTHGQLGFDEMTQPQAIVHDNAGWLKCNMWWHPYDARVYSGTRSAGPDARPQRGRADERLAEIDTLLPRYFGR
ncbi:MAG: aldehyde dehydrogenase family protein [Planctomycetaceae bacterium]